jgi:Sulfatase
LVRPVQRSREPHDRDEAWRPRSDRTRAVDLGSATRLRQGVSQSRRSIHSAQCEDRYAVLRLFQSLVDAHAGDPAGRVQGTNRPGDWVDSLLELDTDFASLLDLLDALGINDNTLVIFAGDNGPEEVLLWRGTPGYFEGSYFAGGEGNLRTPCIVRWPGHVQSGVVSNDIMHITDWFATILRAVGLATPDDRVIDGIDQLDWLTGQVKSSRREGYVYWMGREMYGAKWRDFKLVLVEQRYLSDSARPLPTPRLINLITDPQEREAIALPHLHTWVAHHVNRIIGEFEASIRREPLIPAGAPLEMCRGPRRSEPAARQTMRATAPTATRIATTLAFNNVTPGCSIMGGCPSCPTR